MWRAQCYRQDVSSRVRVPVMDLLTTCELLSADTMNIYDPLKKLGELKTWGRQEQSFAASATCLYFELKV